MPVIVDDQLYYRTAEVGRHQQKYPLQMVKRDILRHRVSGLAGWKLSTVPQMETIGTKTSYVTAISRRS